MWEAALAATLRSSPASRVRRRVVPAACPIQRARSGHEDRLTRLWTSRRMSKGLGRTGGAEGTRTPDPHTASRKGPRVDSRDFLFLRRSGVVEVGLEL